jgi:hypothetical protein
MSFDADTLRLIIGVTVVGAAAGMALGGRYMREAKGVAADATRVYKAARSLAPQKAPAPGPAPGPAPQSLKPPTSAPPAPAHLPPAPPPPASSPAASSTAPAPAPAPPSVRRREG